VSGATIIDTTPGRLELSGVIDFRSGPQLRKDGQQVINASQSAELLLDCAAVEKSSSVGVSLLLAFMRDATAEGKTLAMRGLPSDMRQIAEVSGLIGLLPIGE
jgi:phospholipid transport system transporter-binding protein